MARARSIPRGIGGCVTRRTRAIVIGSALSLSLVLAACTSGASSNSNTADAASGGKLLVAGPFNPTSLDPNPQSIPASQNSFQLSSSYMGRLVAIHPPPGAAPDAQLTYADLQPELASSYQALPNGLGYKFTLRKGIVSSWGNPLTSSDVAWTFQRVVATKTGIGLILFSLANINLKDPVTIQDSTHFTLNLVKPSAYALKILELGILGILDEKAVQEHTTSSDPWGYKWLSTHTASFGPYSVTQFTPGVSTTLTANPTYWRGAPKIKTVIYKPVTDPTSALELLEAGTINFDWQIQPSQYEALKADKNISLPLTHQATFVEVVPSFRKGPLSTLAGREAFQDAINRTAIANAIFPGVATPATSCVPNSINPAGFTAFANSTPDLSKARAALAAAGMPNGFTVQLGVAAGTTGDLDQVAAFLQSQLSAVGIKVEVKSYPTITQFVTAAETGAIQASLLLQGPFIPDPAYYFSLYLTPSSPINYGGYNDPAAEASIAEAATTIGPVHDKALVQACTTVVNGLAQIPVFNLPAASAISTQVRGVYDYPNLQLHFDDMSLEP